MSSELKKLYIFFIITLFIFVIAFPYVFFHINNGINYVHVKSLMALKETNHTNVNIYDNKGNIIIMFDDGWKSQFTVGYDYMNKKNMVGSVSIIPQMIDEIDYMNKGDLYTLYYNDWDLLNHTYSHKNLNEINKEAQFYEISRADDWLYKNGFIGSSKTLVYPEGDYNSDTEDILKQLSYASGRSIVEGFNTKNPPNFHEIKVKNVLSTTSVTDICSWIDYAIENNLTLILLFHMLEDNSNGTLMKYRKDDFYKIIDYVDEKRDGLNIINYSDWIQTIK